MMLRFSAANVSSGAGELSVTKPDSRAGKDKWSWFGRQSSAVGIVAFVVLLSLDMATVHPPFPAVLNLQLKLPEGIVGRTEPIVATGTVERGDFILATYQTPERLARTEGKNFHLANVHHNLDALAHLDRWLGMNSTLP